MPKSHEHKLDIVCLQCVVNLKNDYLVLLKCAMFYAKYGDEGEFSRETLKEIGEIE